MIKRVEKYAITLQREFSLKMKMGARILFCEKQMELGLARVFFWAEEDPKEERKETRQFISLIDNEPFESKSMVYRGSIMSRDESKCYHLWERVIII